MPIQFSFETGQTFGFLKSGQNILFKGSNLFGNRLAIINIGGESGVVIKEIFTILHFPVFFNECCQTGLFQFFETI